MKYCPLLIIFFYIFCVSWGWAHDNWRRSSPGRGRNCPTTSWSRGSCLTLNNTRLKMETATRRATSATPSPTVLKRWALLPPSGVSRGGSHAPNLSYLPGQWHDGAAVETAAPDLDEAAACCGSSTSVAKGKR